MLPDRVSNPGPLTYESGALPTALCDPAHITVKPVLVATSIKQATCIKQACIQFPKQANTLKCTCIKQAPVLSKQIWTVP